MEELFARTGFARRFELLSPLGAGATVVYLALDKSRDEKVVLKFIDTPAESAARNGMLQGLRAALRLDSEFVVRTYDVISAASCACLVLEYVEGKTLAELVLPGEPLPALEAQLIISSIVRGLNDIHSCGLLHHDLKLDNVMVSATGKVKIVDLGLLTPVQIAERPARSDTWIDTAEWITGTPANLAPEYFRSGDFDERSELYALGCVAYEIVLGAAPFPQTSFLALVQEKLTQSSGRPNTDVPGPLIDWILKLLATDPAARFESAAAALVALPRNGADAQTDACREHLAQPPPSPIRTALERLIACCDRYPISRRLVMPGEWLLTNTDTALQRLALAVLALFSASVVLAGSVVYLTLQDTHVAVTADSFDRSAVRNVSNAEHTNGSIDVRCGVIFAPHTALQRAALARLVIETSNGTLCAVHDGSTVRGEDLDSGLPVYEVLMPRWPRRSICRVTSAAGSAGTEPDCPVTTPEDVALPTAALPSGVFYALRENASESGRSAADRAAEVWFQDGGVRRKMSAVHRPISHLIAAGDEKSVVFISPLSGDPQGPKDQSPSDRSPSDGPDADDRAHSSPHNNSAVLFVSSGAGEEAEVGRFENPPSRLMMLQKIAPVS